MTRTLWPHQSAAVEAAVAELHSSNRTHVIAACGTGKTTIGAEVSIRTAPNDPVLVVVPTLDLLAQTVAEYVEHLGQRAGTCYGVCMEHMSSAAATGDVERQLSGLCKDVSTDPTTIARWLSRGGRITVFSTYQSLGSIIAAHQVHGAAPWGAVVVDEAHRTVGHAGKAWGVIHKDDLIPGKRRLYMTATARIMNDRGDDAVSMDNVEVFGNEAYKLSFGTAIDSKLLADYRVVVSIITDSEIRELVAKAGSVLSVDGVSAPAQMIAAHVALLKAARTYGLQRVITYHHRVASAGRFAQLLPAVAELVAAEERPPSVKGYMVHGGMTTPARKAILDELAHVPDASMVAVSNARVLGEGVDVPELDGVMFTDPRESPIDIAQAVGRALRRGGRPNKIATIIIPLVVADGDLDSLEAVEGSAFDVVAHTLQAMRAHDERMAAWIDQRRMGLAATDPDVVAAERVRRLPAWLSVDGLDLPDGFVDQIIVRAVERSSAAWWGNYALAVQYYAQHGDLEPSSVADKFLYGWLSANRIRYRKGRLEPERFEALSAIGMVWEPLEQRWFEIVAALERFREQNGDRHILARDVTDDGYNIGERLVWVRNHPERVPEWVNKRLSALGMVWDPQTQRWQDLLDHLEEYRRQHGNIDFDLEYVCPDDGYPLGKRAYYMHTKARELPDWVRTRAETLGMVWLQTRDEAWEKLIRACGKYLEDKQAQGVVQPALADVPNNLITEEGYRLGQQLSYYRQWEAGQIVSPATGKVRPLDPERKKTLDAMGMRWRTETAAKRRSLTAEEAGRLRALQAEDDGTRRTLSKQWKLTESVIEVVDDGVVVPEVAKVLGISDATLHARIRTTRSRRAAEDEGSVAKRRPLTAEEAGRLRALQAEDDGTPGTLSKREKLTEAVIEVIDAGVVRGEVAKALGISDSTLYVRVRTMRSRMETGSAAKRRPLTREETERLRALKAEDDGPRRTLSKQWKLTEAVIEVVDDGVIVPEIAEALEIPVATLYVRVRTMRRRLEEGSAAKRRPLTAEETERLRALQAEDDGTPGTLSKREKLTEAVIGIVDAGVAVSEVAEALKMPDPSLRKRIRTMRNCMAGAVQVSKDDALTPQSGALPDNVGLGRTAAVEPPTPAIPTCYYCGEPAAAELDTGVEVIKLCVRHNAQLLRQPEPAHVPAVIVDGSNIAWVNRNGTSAASYQQLETAVAAIRRHFAGHDVHVVIDPGLPYQVSPDEQDTVREAVTQGTCIQVPAGTVGGGDAVILEWADRTGGIVVSNDAFRPFQDEYPWLRDGQQRLYGAVLLGQEWIFRERVPPSMITSTRQPPGP